MRRFLVIALGLLIAAGDAAAQDAIQVSSSLPHLNMQTVVAGREPVAVADSASTYSVSSSTILQKITARLDAALPAGMALAVRLDAPAGATSLGMVTLTTTAQDVVTNLPVGSSSGHRITYRFTSTLGAGVKAASSTSITFTITPGP